MDKLTQKEALFCQKYVESGGNASEAYRFAYDTTTTNLQTIYTTANKIYNKPHIQKEIKILQDKIFEDNRASINEIVSILTDVIRFDPAELFDEEGAVKPLSKIPKNARRMIQGIEVNELFAGRGDAREMIGYTKKIKLLPKLDAVEKLLKHLGGYEKHNEQRQNINQVNIFQLPDNTRDTAKTETTIDVEAEEVNDSTAVKAVESNAVKVDSVQGAETVEANAVKVDSVTALTAEGYDDLLG